jgi:hypothetical protein
MSDAVEVTVSWRRQRTRHRAEVQAQGSASATCYPIVADIPLHCNPLHNLGTNLTCLGHNLRLATN